MIWTIATYIMRAFEIVLLPVLLVIVYRLVKTELSELSTEIKAEKTSASVPPLCQDCKTVRIDEWACHSTIKAGDFVCIDCCKCPDHVIQNRHTGYRVFQVRGYPFCLDCFKRTEIVPLSEELTIHAYPNGYTCCSCHDVIMPKGLISNE